MFSIMGQIDTIVPGFMQGYFLLPHPGRFDDMDEYERVYDLLVTNELKYILMTDGIKPPDILELNFEGLPDVLTVSTVKFGKNSRLLIATDELLNDDKQSHWLCSRGFNYSRNNVIAYQIGIYEGNSNLVSLIEELK